MFLVVGLGNVGSKYYYNRHNVGFLVAETLANRKRLKFKRWKDIAELCEFTIKDERVILARPLTFMNLSGIAVEALVKFYKIPSENVIVIHDDLDLPTGTIRLKRAGSSAGHKGVQSIIEKIGNNFLRIRIGIGRPKTKDEVVDFVLSDFGEDLEEIKPAIDKAADAAEDLITLGFERAAETYNRRPKKDGIAKTQ